MGPRGLCRPLDEKHGFPSQGRAGQQGSRAGQGRAGQGEGRAGQGRAGQGRVRAGQGRAGQGRARQGRAGQGQGRAGGPSTSTNDLMVRGFGVSLLPIRGIPGAFTLPHRSEASVASSTHANGQRRSRQFRV